METNPYRKTLIADVTLKNHAFRKLHTYSHPHIPNDSDYDLRYIEKPSIHIPYISKTDVDAIIQCFKENTAHEYEMYRIKPVNERNDTISWSIYSSVHKDKYTLVLISKNLIIKGRQ